MGWFCRNNFDLEAKRAEIFSALETGRESMTHIVFLLGSYHPTFSAVGNCAYHVQKCLVDDFDISVISFRNDHALPLDERFEKIDIRRVETRNMRRRNVLTSGAGPLTRAALKVHRAWGAAKRLLAPVTIDRTLVRAFLDRLESLDRPAHVIIPLVFPMESVVAALEYKKIHPEVKVYPYLFDNFVESSNLHVLGIARRLKKNRHLGLEREMLKGADAVLAMHPLQKHFVENFEKPLADKISFLEHPLLIRPKPRDQQPTTAATQLCYTGSLIRNLREPDYLLDLLRGIRVNVPVRADFFIMGNDADKVKTETIGEKVQIINHGRVPKDQADVAIVNANMLLNIGEVRGRQISSKVFEYMATGKPIIHLAYVNDDVDSKIIEKYPLAITLLQDRAAFDENCKRLSEFIENNSFRQISFAEVEILYPEALPETTCAFLRELIDVHGSSSASDKIRPHRTAAS